MFKKFHLRAYSIIIAELLVGIMAIIAFLSLLLIISRDHLSVFDQKIVDWVYSFRSNELTEIMKFFTFLGGEIVLIGGIILLLALLYKKHKVSSFNFAVLLVFGTIVNVILKYVFQRPRPDYLPLLFESTYSFPSGHSMNSFIFYSCILYFVIRNTHNNYVRVAASLITMLLVLTIGVSRIYLGVHYPSDVLAGFTAGVMWFVIIVVIEKTARKVNLFKKS